MWPVAYSKIVAHGTRSTAMESYPVYSTPLMVTGKTVGMAMLTPRSRMKPATSEIQMELTMPLGAEMRASTVSSDTCAEAS